MKILRLTTLLDFGGQEKKYLSFTENPELLRHKYVFSAFGYGGNAERKLKERGFEVHVLIRNFSIRNLSNIWAVYRLINQIRWQTADPLWRKSFFKVTPFKEGLMNSQEWLMHGKALLNLKNEKSYNLKETFTQIRRGNLRMSSNKSSHYYRNQKKARVYLLNEMLNKGNFQLNTFYQLLKQITVFQYWELKQK